MEQPNNDYVANILAELNSCTQTIDGKRVMVDGERFINFLDNYNKGKSFSLEDTIDENGERKIIRKDL